MPIMKCKRDGKNGYKWGLNGFCYIGERSKELALKQGRAQHENKGKKNGRK